jgi:hypothetical protein
MRHASHTATLVFLFAATILASSPANAASTCNLLASVDQTQPTGSDLALTASASSISVIAGPQGIGGTAVADNGSALPISATATPLSIDPTKHTHVLTINPPLGSTCASAEYHLLQFDGWSFKSTTQGADAQGNENFNFKTDSALRTLTLSYAPGKFPHNAVINATFGPAEGSHVDVIASGDIDGVPSVTSIILYNGVDNVLAIPMGSAPQFVLTGCGSQLPALATSVPLPAITMGLVKLENIKIGVDCSSDPYRLTSQLQLSFANMASRLPVTLDKPLDESQVVWSFGGPAALSLTNDITYDASSVDIAGGVVRTGGTLKFSNTESATSIPVQFGPAGAKFTIPSGGIDIPMPSADLKLSEFDCPVNVSAFSCTGIGTITLPQISESVPGVSITIQVSNNKLATSAGPTSFKLGALTLSFTQLAANIQAGDTTITGVGTTLASAAFPGTFSVDNFKAEQTKGAFTYSGTFSSKNINLGTLANVTGVKGAVSSTNGITLNFGSISLRDPYNPNEISLSATTPGANLTFSLSGDSPSLTIPSFNEVKGSFFGRKVTYCTKDQLSQAIPDQGGTNVVCAAIHLTPGAFTSTHDILVGRLSFQPDIKGISLQDATLSYSEPSKPLTLRIGSTSLNVNDVDLDYVRVPATRALNDSTDPANDPWFSDVDLSNCRPFLQGSMTISTGVVLAGTSPGSADSSVAIGDDCIYGLATGLVYINMGPSASAVIEKFAVARVKKTAPSTSYATMVSAQGRLQFSNATFDFDRLGFSNDGSKTKTYHQFNTWRSAGYTAAQNIGPILTGIGALIYSLFHHI